MTPYVPVNSSINRRWYAMVSLYLSSSYNTIRLPLVIIPTFIPKNPGKALWVVWDSYPVFLPSGFVTTAATPLLIIFTSFSGYPLYISVCIK